MTPVACEAVAAWLQATLGRKVERVDLIARGSADVYRATAVPDTFAVHLSPAPRSPDGWTAESRILSAIAGRVATARWLLATDEPVAFGGVESFVRILHWVEGSEADPGSAAFYRDVASMLAALHAVPAGAGLPLACIERFAGSAAERYALAAISEAARARVEPVIASPCRSERALIHGDPLARNVIRRPDGTHVLIDLADGGIGHAEYDAAAVLYQTIRAGVRETCWPIFQREYAASGGTIDVSEKAVRPAFHRYVLSAIAWVDEHRHLMTEENRLSYMTWADELLRGAG